MSISEKIAAFEAKLSGDAGHLVDEFKQLVHALLGQTETDAEQLAGEAASAAAPVVADAEHDAAALGETAVTEAGQLAQTAAADVSTQSAPAAAPTTPLATGGPVTSVGTVLVGESGPETLVPPTAPEA